MNAWVKGFAVGAIAGLALAILLAGGTRFEAFVRVAASGRYLLDARLDESALGRVINLPVASLGEASVVKRSWFLATTYHFVLLLRPEVAPGPGREVQELQVSVTLPGRATSTNATRITGGTALWEALPDVPLYLDTTAVHWGRALLVAAIAGIGIAVGRRPDLFGRS